MQHSKWQDFPRPQAREPDWAVVPSSDAGSKGNARLGVREHLDQDRPRF
jgi:hypothetical protein